ncbi:MAG: SDR family NAD(P)-dependent oxidoreductase [Deltaproteobacteria bacterium]|jgi:NAD(P)-dependent dehydrogenase (short-subunit alcohol dehydrogenase family)|nr:SDR family NAD(P)-dependent oxidoreductase [Deltaproteobacteria bacterium]
MRLKGKVALITGSTRGIGKEFAIGFAKEGAEVIINGRNLGKAKAVAEEIKNLGVKSIAIGADVSLSQDVTRMVEEAIQSLGRIDILVNNAGVNPFILEAEKIKEEGWDQVIDVNLKGVFLCCQAVGKKMIEQGGGKIINISSVVGFLGEQGFLPYSVSKAGVMMLTRVLAYEWSKYHVTVNAIAPGFIAGGMNSPILNNEILVSGLTQQVPLKRLGKPEEIVQVALFLASEDSSYINGTTIVADGGMTGYRPVGFIDLIAEMMKKRG